MNLTYHNQFLINSSEPASAAINTHFGFSNSEIDPSVQAPSNPLLHGHLNLLYYQPAGINMSTTATTEEASSVFEAMREMMFRMAAMQPVLEQVHPDIVKPKKRKNIRISSQPQTVAARQRRERISERIGILRMMVPGGSKMDTASMLDEAIRYVKFLKQEVKSLEEMASSCGFSADVMWPDLKGAGSGSVDGGSCPYNTTDNSSCSSDNSRERTFVSPSYSNIGEGN